MTNQITVDSSLCTSDGACVAVCASRSLVLNKSGFPEEATDSACIECGHCVAVCPTGALHHAGLPQEPFLPAAKKLPSPSLIDDFLRSRRSVREFKKETLAKTTLAALLDVARRAPTASNSQRLHWIVVNDALKVRALSEETVKWLRTSNLPAARLTQWESGYDFVLRGAPAVIMVCTPASYEWGKQDCSIALTFLELAAEASGLGVCWAGFLTRVAAVHAPLRQMLSVPEGYAAHGGIMLGKPTYSYRLVPPRNPLSVQWA
jgi:nitroreductase/NAD-dependent dihydropyrimidine dehydrogenase PreA subunit